MSQSARNTSRRPVLLAALLTALAAASAPLTPGAHASTADALAGGAPTPPEAAAFWDNYGAISLAFTGGAVGWSYDYGTKASAKRAAQRACRARSDYPWSCRKIAWVRNGCLALAVRWDNDGDVSRYGWAVRRNRTAAYRVAKRECGWGCVRRAYTCTSR